MTVESSSIVEPGRSDADAAASNLARSTNTRVNQNSLKNRRVRATRRWRSVLVYSLVAMVGVVAFAWPFWLPGHPGVSQNQAHQGDAWIWATLLGGLVVAALVVETSQRRMNGATIATLGVLASMNGLLRFIQLPGGNAIFFLTILAGAALGARFGMLLGLTAMAASAVITAGIGPWLPYQMLALSAMGTCAGWLGSSLQHRTVRVQLAALAIFAWAWQFLYGAIMNLWFWPLIRNGGPLDYAPGLGFTATLHRYWSFYVASSFAWDAGGAAVNCALILTLGAPILRSLRRIAHRLDPSTVWL